jgi:hypothetical protein
MTQLSRPYQIALVAMALFVAVWFLAVRGRTTTPEAGSASSSASPVVSSAQLAQSEAKSAATPTPVRSGTAPGVAGLTRAINKAHHAVATSQLNAKQLAEKSAQASSPGTAANTPATKAAPSTAAKPAPAAHAKTHAATAAPAPKPKPAPAAKPHSAAKAVSPEASVEAQLAQGKLVAILFWNPKSTVDQTVGRELAAAARSLHGKLVIHVTGADRVGAFGSITREVQVNQTPTILLIRKTGSTMVLTGLTDAYAIEQALDELRA